ncbi:MAG TPA: hypothetical protein VG245_07660, partial [Candidatus Dormibacteraeota bacterium]|nr:hypothetical protein [Candidatus Dormibacteraeota bacterium]
MAAKPSLRLLPPLSEAERQVVAASRRAEDREIGVGARAVEERIDPGALPLGPVRLPEVVHPMFP